MDPNLRRTVTDEKIDRLVQVVRQLRLQKREMSAQELATLFYVGSRHDCHKTALEEDLNFTTASSSRNTDKLSKDHRLDGKLGKNGKLIVKAGLDLIIKEVEDEAPRRQRLRLTKKGEDLMKQIKSILYD
jgi:DNA-binding MarR family transcriptional regulator